MAEQDKFEAMEVKTRKQAEEAARRQKAKKRNYIVGFSVLGACTLGLVALYVCAAQIWLVDLTALPYIEYSYSSNKGTTTATLTRVIDTSDYPSNFRVPEKVNGLTITAIGDNAFAGCDRISSISMPDTVTSIGDYAFAGLEGLTDIYFSKNITHLGTDVFKDTEFLNQLPTDGVSVISQIVFNVGEDVIEPNTVLLADHDSIIPDKYKGDEYNVTYIADWGEKIGGWGEALFANNKNIVYAEIPSYLDEVPIKSFYNASNLEGIKFVGDTSEIEAEAFRATKALKDVVLSDKITTIGDRAFENSGIDGLSLSENVTKLGRAIFKGCKNITSFDWPSHLDIPNETFAGCENLATINIDEEGYQNISSLGRQAFAGTALTEFYVPKNVSSISMGLFNGASQLESVYLYKGNKDYDRTGKLVSTGVKTIDSQAFKDTALKEIRLVDENKAFVSPSNTLSFPISFDIFAESGAIGETFAGSDITSFTFPATVKTTTYGMFKGCHNLTEINFEQRHLGPNIIGLEQIALQTFAGCDSLQSITLPDTIKTIGAGAFKDMTGLKTVNLPSEKSTYSIIEANMFANDVELQHVNLSKNVYFIKENAFSGNHKLDYIYLSYDVNPKLLAADRGAIDNMRLTKDGEGNEIILSEEEKMPIFVSFAYKDVSSRYLPAPILKPNGDIAQKGWYDKATCHVFYKGDWELDSEGKPVPTDYTIRDEVKEGE